MTFGRHPDMSQLRAAIAVQDEGTVTAAAQSLGLSQPAVSRLVAMLEADLGFAVFERSRKRLLVTERGSRFLDEARRALAAMTRLAIAGRELAQGQRGLLRIGAIPALAHGVLAQAIGRHVRRAPDIVLDIRQLPRHEQIVGLRAGWLDAGLAALPFSASGLRVEPIGEAVAQCFLPAGHALARCGVVMPADLATETLILGRDESLLRQRVDDAFRQAGIRKRALVVTESTPLVLSLIAAGAGLSIGHAMPEAALPAGVIARRFEPRLAFTYAVMTQAAETRSSMVDLLRDTLREAGRSAWS